jgi:hypothetical protein
VAMMDVQVGSTNYWVLSSCVPSRIDLLDP